MNNRSVIIRGQYPLIQGKLQATVTEMDPVTQMSLSEFLGTYKEIIRTTGGGTSRFMPSVNLKIRESESLLRVQPLCLQCCSTFEGEAERVEDHVQWGSTQSIVEVCPSCGEPSEVYAMWPERFDSALLVRFNRRGRSYIRCIGLALIPDLEPPNIRLRIGDQGGE